MPGFPSINGLSDEYSHYPVATSHYSYPELAELYNQARTDYIVPMPMNARKMQEYVEHYDIDLAMSAVAVDKDDEEPNGICMLGVREDRTWITRLGVIPVRRRRKSGEFLMHVLLEGSRQANARLTQLEVIKGNEPAYRLFRKLGFEETRELLVIRRPPGPLEPHLVPEMVTTELSEDEIHHFLDHREPGAAWTEETASLRNMGNLKGYSVELSDGETGWVVFQYTPFQLGHFVFSSNSSADMLYALITAVHSAYPLHDTKIENLPVDDPTWPQFQRSGYMEAFRRIEMFLYY